VTCWKAGGRPLREDGLRGTRAKPRVTHRGALGRLGLYRPFHDERHGPAISGSRMDALDGGSLDDVHALALQLPQSFTDGIWNVLEVVYFEAPDTLLHAPSYRQIRCRSVSIRSGVMSVERLLGLRCGDSLHPSDLARMARRPSIISGLHVSNVDGGEAYDLGEPHRGAGKPGRRAVLL